MEKTRFEMIKERHTKTFEKALTEGKMDKEIIELCSFIAKTKNYYTLSSCSGRIILLERRGDKKMENFFHRRWHRTITKEELLEGLSEKVKGELWFKVDPFILHVGCEDLEHATKILNAMKEAGVKRGGITLTKKGKFLLELIGTERLEVPLKLNGKEIFTEEQLNFLFEKVNPLLEKNFSRLKKLENEFKKNLI